MFSGDRPAARRTPQGSKVTRVNSPSFRHACLSGRVERWEPGFVPYLITLVSLFPPPQVHLFPTLWKTIWSEVWKIFAYTSDCRALPSYPELPHSWEALQNKSFRTRSPEEPRENCTIGHTGQCQNRALRVKVSLYTGAGGIH